ncbi:MAG: hypothetical protein IKM18_02640 [Clostridia bacterium]|nr:hypothetical protein [Clostridia bacterium]
MVRLTADFTEKVRPMGKMNGMNNGPLHTFYDATEEFKEMGVDFVRFHETHSPVGKCIEVPFIFPDFDADEFDENNYYFDETDAVIKAAVDNSIEIAYRFGMGTEGTLPKIFCIVPKDYAKWARICIQILKHYNDGWANGFHYGIKLCEIWNEADLYDYWRGEGSEYIKFYCIVSKMIKEYDPSLRVGSSGFAFGIPDVPVPDAPEGVKANYKKRYDFFHNYLEAVLETKAPMDFFAWHCYVYRSSACVKRIEGILDLLREYGLENVENINTEWGPITLHHDAKGVWDMSQHDTIKSAITFLASMIVMQNYGTTKAAYYDADPRGAFCGLYEYDGTRKHSFYSAKAFSMLRKGEMECKTEGQTSNVRVCASYNGGKAYVAVTCEEAEEEVSLKLLGLEKAKVNYYFIDETHNLELVRTGSFSGRAINLKMPRDSAYLLELEF